MKLLARWVCVLMFATFFSGCVMGSAQRITESHFVYPNSNVSPMHQVEGSKTKLCGILFINWNGFTAEAEEVAYQRALEGGGDLVINGHSKRSSFFFPGLFSTCTTTVTGTSAKMAVGKQELR